jgi:NADP-dependent 3-hydroxy acid dehydrogenase YdfG
MEDSTKTPGTALVIGASGGIGKAVVAALSNMGIAVAMTARDREKLERVRIELGTACEKAVTFSCDITDRAAVKDMVEAVLARQKSIDILVIAAGLNVPKRSLRSLDPADFDRVISANLTGAFNVIHHVLPSMRTAGSGLIVQISSLAGLRASTITGAAYSAAKFAQTALGVNIGREERGRGIRSTVICAGEVNTDFLEARAVRPGGGVGAGDDSRRQSILQPSDIAAAVRFLVELPPRAHVPELVIKPTIDDFS